MANRTAGWCYRRWLVTLLAMGAAAAASARAEQPAPCLECHSGAAVRDGAAHAAVPCKSCHPANEVVPHARRAPAARCAGCHETVAGDHASSVHGQARKWLSQAPNCSSCHGGAHELKPANSDAFRQAVPALCSGCHAPVAREYAGSVHGKALSAGVLASAACTDCHDEHSIQRVSAGTSAVSASRVVETCSRCHANVRLTKRFGLPPDRVVSFNASFHGLAWRSGRQTVANCATCHGAHKILPASDPNSSVNAKNLAATCSKCHARAGTRFALGPVHVWPGRAEPPAVKSVRLAYWFMIPLLGGLMLLHNGGDWVRKLRARRRGSGEGRWQAEWSPQRMYRFERFLHALLAASVVLLAWTGFDLLYPEQWWAQPIVAMERHWEIRGVIHRAAAVLFIGTALAHVISLVYSRELRAHWRELRLSRADFRNAARSLAYNAGLAAAPPETREYGFFEKFTYWATVWGAAVMIGSGLTLWIFPYSLGWLPRSVLDAATAIHFYEAVLACLVLVAWHAYRVILDPKVYPMDTTWILGRNLRENENSGLEASHQTLRPTNAS